MSFILPTAIVRIIDFVGLNEKNEIIFNSNNNKYALCKTLDNQIILIRFLSNLKKIDLDEKVLKDFFYKKALKVLNNKNILQLAKELSSDKEKKKEISNLLKSQIREEQPDIEEDDLLMEVLERLSVSFEDEAKKILLNDKIIQKGSVIRLPLSLNKKEEAFLQNNSFNIYDSYSILMNKNFEPNTSGIYLFSSNQHSIPLIFEKNKTKETYSVRLNSTFANKSILISLLRHAIRTFRHKNGYMITIYLKDDKKTSSEILELVKKLNICSKSESEKNNYIPLLENIIEWINNNENEKILTFRKSFIYLPKQLQKEFFYTETLFSNLSKGLLNISFKLLDNINTEELLLEIENKQMDFFSDKKIYGFYNILYLNPAKDSDTYGFLENNIQSHQIMSGFEDSLLFYEFLKEDLKDKLKNEFNNSNNSDNDLLEI